MLENLDIVLAFTMIMLLLSLLATIVVQMVVSLLGLRGKNLFWAVEQLFVQAAPGTGAQVKEKAGQIAGKVLGHAILSPHAAIRQRLRAGKAWKGRYGPTALRLEDMMLVFDQMRSRGGGEFRTLLAGQAEASAPSDDWIREVTDKLKKAFPDEADRLEEVAMDSAATAERLGDVIERLKETFPERADKLEKVAQGALAEAKGWAKEIEAWFEMAMDAAHERFKMWSRWITAGAAVLLAFGFQINSIDIVRQLSDQDVRAQVLSQVETVEALSKATLVDDDPGSDPAVRYQQLQKALRDTRTALGETGLKIFGPVIWDACWDWRKLGGSLVTALLLSLGAPFWYGAFKKLLSLRSIVTEKQEAQSGQR